MLSAAILNYPPPTLIGYGAPGGSERPGADVVKNAFSFLLGKEAHEDDLILVVEEGMLQGPVRNADLTFSRCLVPTPRRSHDKPFLSWNARFQCQTAREVRKRHRHE
jgi:hypothetical protein